MTSQFYTTIRKNTQNIAIAIFIGILVSVGGYLIFQTYSKATMKTYNNTIYGISFQYPETYTLTERNVPQGETGTTITLTERGLTLPIDGEGPTAISIDIYTKKTSLENWIRTSPYSNFNLAQQMNPATTTIAEKNAFLYTWDGLYQGTTVATEHEGRVVMFSVTYDGQTDLSKREDFTDLITHVTFLQPEDTAPVPTSK